AGDLILSPALQPLACTPSPSPDPSRLYGRDEGRLSSPIVALSDLVRGAAGSLEAVTMARGSMASRRFGPAVGRIFCQNPRGDTFMLGAKLGISDYLNRVCQDIQNMDRAQIEAVSNLIEAAYDEGRFVFIIGNGGSGANASHFCEDLAKC